MMKYLLLVLCLLPKLIFAQIICNNYPATDALGRKLPEFKEVGPPKKGKFVGVFYSIWHTAYSRYVPLNASEILSKYPEAIYDFNNPAWRPADGSFFFWGEPLFGYYKDTDPWVLRKHAEMLAYAGVDVVVLDCSNGDTYKESYLALFKAFAEARKDGVKTPYIAFMLPFGITDAGRSEIKELFTQLYQPGLYKGLWFYWKGKPLIMAYPELANGDASVPGNDMKNFFTFRPAQGLYDNGPQRPDNWGWLQIYPQHGFVPETNSGFEQMPVGVAQNWSKARGLTAMNSPGVFGRSYTTLSGLHTNKDAVNYGYNFQEQWYRALRVNPEFIFITGWNEWIAGRYKSWEHQANAFPDEFSEERSRDIEPMKGGHQDDYYYQMVSNIRRFKGVAKPQPDSGRVYIKQGDSFPDWSNVAFTFITPRGNTLHRDFDGWKGLHYTNNTGRNNIVLCKVASDKKFLYFYVETAGKLSKTSDSGWMWLLIDIDRNKKTGWDGYDFMVNRINPSKRAVLERSKKSWKWTKVADLDYQVKDNKLQIKISKEALGIKTNSDLEFKWCDNIQEDGNNTDFLINGDASPFGRFNYRYSCKIRK